MDAQIEDGWRHKLQSERGEYRGKLQTMQRFLSTALDAVYANPADLPCVIERLQNSLSIIKGELDRIEGYEI